ncbi:MAG: nucleoside triphosphate pyrophosphatase [Thermoleophilia bacterium]
MASGSPQRRALLESIGLPFRVVVSGVDEVGDAAANARDKARAVAASHGIPPGGAVLGADTQVLAGGRVFEKPADAAEARAMLTALSGGWHEVATAVHLIAGSGEHALRDVARVRFRRLAPAAVDWYLATGEWRGRAGGYAVQLSGAALVERIEGDYTTVVGLPLGALVGLLEAVGLAPWSGTPSGGAATLS